ncbi:hypothetical protein D3C79_836490 [compost metagenome]
MSRMPFFLTMPISSTTPIRPMMLKSCPLAHSRMIAPRPAEGRVEIMVSGWTKLS